MVLIIAQSAPLLVSAPCATADSLAYVNFAGRDGVMCPQIVYTDVNGLRVNPRHDFLALAHFW
jgi:hypothetical protein